MVVGLARGGINERIEGEVQEPEGSFQWRGAMVYALLEGGNLAVQRDIYEALSGGSHSGVLHNLGATSISRRSRAFSPPSSRSPDLAQSQGGTSPHLKRSRALGSLLPGRGVRQDPTLLR